jgi:hypothetical protein
MTDAVPFAFGLLAFAASAFYGASACSIFDVSTTGKRWPWKLHQFWLNFAGSAVGWIALWSLLPGVIGCLTQACSANISWSDGGVFFLAFVGITGHLPVVVVGLAMSVKEIASKIAGVLK